MNDYYTPGGVQLRKAVYVLKCPVCGAELKSDQSGECPYCGAYLDVVNTAPIPPQGYGAPSAYPQQNAGTAILPPQEMDRRIRSWKKKQTILIAVYCILAAISILGISFINEGETGYDLVMTLTAIGYLPLSFALPIYLPGTRPDDCYKALGYPKPPHKALTWFIYTLVELGLAIALFVLVVLIQGE